MSAHTSSHASRDPQHATSRGAVRWTVLAALCLLLGWAWSPFPASPPLAHAASAQSPNAALPFVPSALGATTDAVILFDAPFDGVALEMLPRGARVSLGGEIQRRGVFLTRRSYWVEVDSGAQLRYGFVRASDVVVTAGYVTPLDVRGLSREALLAPAPPVGGEPVAAGASMAPRDAGQASLGPTLLASAGAASVPVSASRERIGIAWLPETVVAWQAEIEAAASRHGVSPDLLAIVLLVESGGDPTAESPSGARGLMQVMPGTGRDIAQRRGIAGFEVASLSEPETNIDFGAWYLAEQLGAFGRADDADWQRSVELAASAYNGGPAHVGQHLTTGQPLFAETNRYQRWVGGMWSERDQAASATYEAWWQAGGHLLVAAARERAAR